MFEKMTDTELVMASIAVGLAEWTPGHNAGSGILKFGSVEEYCSLDDRFRPDLGSARPRLEEHMRLRAPEHSMLD